MLRQKMSSFLKKNGQYSKTHQEFKYSTLNLFLALCRLVHKCSKPIKGFFVKEIHQKYNEKEDCIIKLVYKPKKGMFETLRDLQLGSYQTSKVRIHFVSPNAKFAR